MRERKIDEAIAARLRARRLLLNLSQEFVAAKVKISPQQVHKYETGQTRVGASRLASLANALQVPVAYFFGPLNQKNDQANLHDDIVKMLGQPNAVMALQKFNNLPKQIQLNLIELMHSFGTEIAPRRDGNEVSLQQQIPANQFTHVQRKTREPFRKIGD